MADTSGLVQASSVYRAPLEAPIASTVGKKTESLTSQDVPQN